MRGLGMTASGPRNIKPGHQYDKYFDTNKLVGSDKVVLTGTTFDTLDQMASIVHSTLDDTKAISHLLKGTDRYATAQNIWNFLYDHIDYVKDSTEFEELRRPLRTWKDRKGDCDCYSIFASSVLTNLGIDHAYRMTGYKGDFQHVYVVIPKRPNGSITSRSNYIVIDPVTDRFDYEVPYSKKFDKIMKMPIKYLNGIEPGTIASIPQQQAYTYPYGFEFATIGLDGLGATDNNPATLAEDFVRRMRMHLINTLKELNKNPSIPNSHGLAAQIDQVLRVWGDPAQRDGLIAKFSTGDGGLNGLDGFFDKIGDAFRKVGKAVGNGWEKVKEVATKVGTAVLRYNPVTASARLTVEGVFRNNIFNASTKLGYGYWSLQQARANDMDINNWRNYVEKRKKVEKLWVDFLGGKKDKLKEFILMGHQTGTKKRNLPRIASHFVGRPEPTRANNRLSGTGLGAEPVTAVVGAGATTTFIAKITSWLKELIDPKELFHKAVDKIIPGQQQVPAWYPPQVRTATYPPVPTNPYAPGQPVQQGNITSENNINKWLLMGAAGLATILMVNSGKENKPQTSSAKGMSGTPASPAGGPKSRSTGRPAAKKRTIPPRRRINPPVRRTRKSLPTMVMS